jgi:hypothetical protein
MVALERPHGGIDPLSIHLARHREGLPVPVYLKAIERALLASAAINYRGKLPPPETANLTTGTGLAAQDMEGTAESGCPQLTQLLSFVSLNLSLDLVRLSLQFVTEHLQFIGALTLSFCAFALRFCEAENTLCLSHEVLDVLFGEHAVPYLSTTGGRTSGPTPVDKVLVGDVL